MVLSQKDTIQVLDLTNQFMTAVKEQRYADAAMMLHEMKTDDPFAKPELLDNEQLKSVLQRLKAFPIYDYTISDCIFKVTSYSAINDMYRPFQLETLQYYCAEE